MQYLPAIPTRPIIFSDGLKTKISLPSCNDLRYYCKLVTRLRQDKAVFGHMATLRQGYGKKNNSSGIVLWLFILLSVCLAIWGSSSDTLRQPAMIHIPSSWCSITILNVMLHLVEPCIIVMQHYEPGLRSITVCLRVSERDPQIVTHTAIVLQGEIYIHIHTHIERHSLILFLKK